MIGLNGIGAGLAGLAAAAATAGMMHERWQRAEAETDAANAVAAREIAVQTRDLALDALAAHEAEIARQRGALAAYERRLAAAQDETRAAIAARRADLQTEKDADDDLARCLSLPVPQSLSGLYDDP